MNNIINGNYLMLLHCNQKFNKNIIENQCIKFTKKIIPLLNPLHAIHCLRTQKLAKCYASVTGEHPGGLAFLVKTHIIMIRKHFFKLKII